MRSGDRTLLVSYEGILTNGKFDGLLVVMSDITEELGANAPKPNSATCCGSWSRWAATGSAS